MAQRLVRAKAKIKRAGIPYRVPDGHELPDRLTGVLRVIYLVFNEAYLSQRPDEPVRIDLAEEAIRLGRALAELMPDEPEVGGLLALMLAQHARADARFDERGDLVLLEHQDRARWDRVAIGEAGRILDTAMRRRSIGTYQLQAAIAVLHSESPSFADTDWPQIAALYGLLAGADPSPTVRLNRAVAVGFASGPAAGLAAIDELESSPASLPQAHLFAAARAEFLVRLGEPAGAVAEFERALTLGPSDAERRHLERRIRAVRSGCR